MTEENTNNYNTVNNRKDPDEEGPVGPAANAVAHGGKFGSDETFSEYSSESTEKSK
jgi:hypothetical protein